MNETSTKSSDQETSILPEKAKPHSLAAKTLHWGFIILFAYGLFKQLDSLDQLEDFALLQFEMVFAAIFLIVVVARYAFMRMTMPTALPDDTSKSIKFMARAAHLGMYISLSTIAISGLIVGGLYWAGFTSGLLINAMVGLHGFSVTVTYVLILLHIVAAVYHRFKGDGIWNSMVPLWREKERP